MPATSHDEVLRALLDLCQGSKPVVKDVWLVSRVKDGGLLGTAALDQACVFVPDMHLLTKKCEAKYQYGFHKLDATKSVDRTTLFVRVAEALSGLNVRCVQLGDYADLWREDDTGEGGDQAEWNAITRDNADVHKAVSQTLRASILAGNHDYSASRLPALKNPRWLTLKSAGLETVLVTHGDCFDALEDLDDGFQQAMVAKFGPAVLAGEYLLDRTTVSGTTKSKPVGGPPVKLSGLPDVPNTPLVNAWQTDFDNNEEYPRQKWGYSHGLLGRAFYSSLKFRSGVEDNEFKQVKKSLKPARTPLLPDLRAIVIGHSHCPRICIHKSWPRKTGTPAQRDGSLVFIDCGAWIEWSRLAPTADRQPSCHLGVLCGDDFRIYQLNPHPRMLKRT